MKILITGSNGFIGKNLVSHLNRRKDVEILPVTRSTESADLQKSIRSANFIFHLAGVNRPKNTGEFDEGNTGFTKRLCDILIRENNQAPIVFTSSLQADLENDYGRSKLNAERILYDLHTKNGNPVHIFRLENVFGKWSRPNYNSVVSTFCYNISHGLPIEISEPDKELTLIYIDDVIKSFEGLLSAESGTTVRAEVQPKYRITLSALAETLQSFKANRSALLTDRVGSGILRALYATYLSYLEPSDFSYDIASYPDVRGTFVEMLKTRDSGQFSFFTAHPGITRGSHYHHSKTEKFLIIKGSARFKFRHIIDGRRHTIHASGTRPQIIETIPGWVHDITNIGDDELIVMLWANEVFDREKPDTYSQDV